jgi:twinkle protein
MSDSILIDKGQCPKCAAAGNDTSGDNLGIYDDGHTYCFSCGDYNGHGTTGATAKVEVLSETTFISTTTQAIPNRQLAADVCRKYNYGVGTNKHGEPVHVASYYADGKVVAQHTRGKEKAFRWIGDTSSLELFGQHLFKNNGNGKRLFITEGELDCLSVAQALGNTWPVVSVPNGASSAVKYIKANLEFVNSYPDVILAFDMDDPGQEAALAVASLLPPGKCRIAALPEKDPNACLVSGNTRGLVSALYEARVHSPDEILHVSDVISSSDMAEDQQVFPFPYDSISEYLIGQRSHEITLYCSGTGSGKSTFLRELAYGHLVDGRSVGVIMLEESPQETLDDMISLVLSKPVRAIRAGRMMNDLRSKMGKDPISMDIIDDLSDEEYAAARRELGETSFYIYDHLGNAAMSCLLARIEYMATSLGVDVIMLDHITAAAAGLMGIADKDIGGGGGERIIIDTMMKELRAISTRTGVHIDIVSQLKKTDKAYEEGARITMQDLRGSGSLASVPNTVIALERDRQHENKIVSNTTIVRVLKNRLTGRSGVCATLWFNHATNRMEEIYVMLDGQDVILEADFTPNELP